MGMHGLKAVKLGRDVRQSEVSGVPIALACEPAATPGLAQMSEAHTYVGQSSNPECSLTA